MDDATFVDVGVIVIGPVIVAVHVNVNPTVEVIDAVVGDSWLTPSTGRITTTVSFPFTCHVSDHGVDHDHAHDHDPRHELVTNHENLGMNLHMNNPLGDGAFQPGTATALRGAAGHAGLPAMRPCVAVLVCVCACGRGTAPRPSDDGVHEARPGATTPGPGAVAEPAAPRDGRYQGRPIAQTCSYLGADWLERPDRAEREQPDRVLDALHLDPHSTVADVGAGTGYFTLRLAHRVAKVLATDLQPEMLQLLAANAAREHLTNVEAIRAGEHDAALPPGCCDLVLLVDVYHELSDPPAVMAGIRRALTDHGRLVLVEYRGEDPAVAIKPEHKMTLPRIQQELGALGFAFVESLEFLPDQRVVVFTSSSP